MHTFPDSDMAVLHFAGNFSRILLWLPRSRSAWVNMGLALGARSIESG